MNRYKKQHSSAHKNRKFMFQLGLFWLGVALLAAVIRELFE
jgi:hypothetical protein